MNISNLFGSGFSTAWKSPFSSAAPASESVKELSPLALAVQRADKRVQNEVDVNTAQLSSFGRLKASVSDVQIAAKALTDLSAESSISNIQSAVSRMLGAFNGAADTAQTTAALPGASVASESARRVERDLQQAVTADVRIASALKDIGIEFRGNALKLDVDRLDASLASDPDHARAVLAELGQQLDTTSTAELQAHGNVNESMDRLRQLAKVLESQQSALQSAAQATLAGTASRGHGHPIAAYQAAMKNF